MLDVNTVNICDGSSSTLKVFQVLGIIFFIIKIIVPIIIIVLGMIDFGKSAINGEDKANSEAIKTLFKRIVLGIIIFFIPTVLDVLLSFVNGVSDVAKQYEGCTKCLVSPSSSSCKPKDLTNKNG